MIGREDRVLIVAGSDHEAHLHARDWGFEQGEYWIATSAWELIFNDTKIIHKVGAPSSRALEELIEKMSASDPDLTVVIFPEAGRTMS